MSPEIHPRLLWGVALFALAIVTTQRAVAANPPPGDGVWKFPPAPEQIHGEFNNEDL
jgi:hypothetical protein